jgi:hypothetical protein
MKSQHLRKKTKYTRKHYQSKDGMLTYIWGPPMWHYLHTMSFNYPLCPTNSDKRHYRSFLLHLQYVLPCGKCRENLKKNFAKLPPLEKHFASRATFSRYIYQLHETVNTMLEKKSGLTYEQVRERYEHFRARCYQSTTTSSAPTEDGCVDPVYGTKSKCLLKIVPLQTSCQTLEIDKKCLINK